MRTIASELGPQVERLSDQPRIYADANVPAGVIANMRNRLGWDVFAVIEHDDLRRASDVEHYRLARQLQRTLVVWTGTTSTSHDFRQPTAAGSSCCRRRTSAA